MPTIIVEDGSGVPNANSYASVADARSYASDREVTLDADDNVVGSLLILAMDYLESRNYLGAPLSFTQPLSWPRQQLLYDPDTPVPNNVIPPNLKAAQMQLVIEQTPVSPNGGNGIVLQPSRPGNTAGAGAVVEEKVDVLTTRYSERIGTTMEPVMPKVQALLRGLLVPEPYLKTVRL